MRTFTLVVCAAALCGMQITAQGQGGGGWVSPEKLERQEGSGAGGAVRRHPAATAKAEHARQPGGGAPSAAAGRRLKVMPVGPETIGFFAHEIGPMEVIKGAPYSAETVTEFKQLLGDGNIIQRTDTGLFYRDGEGRTRTEVTVFEGDQGSQSGRLVITITDPAGGFRYFLNPATRTGTKLALRRENAEVLAHRERTGGEPGLKVSAVPPAVHVPGAGVREENIKREMLGKRKIEGVEAEGVRATSVLAAGEVGNVRPIETVSERWFSPEIKALVSSRHSDPRSGEYSYQLRNVRLGEPSPSLFQVPADYNLRESSEWIPMRSEYTAQREMEQREADRQQVRRPHKQE